MARTTSPSVSILRAGLIMVGVLVLQMAFVISYVGALHAPKAEGVPVVIVGTPDVAQQFAQALNNSRTAGIHATVDTDEARARESIKKRENYAAYVFGTDSDKLVVASAASAAVADGLSQAFSQTATQLQRQLTFEDTYPLPTSDPRGLGGFYLVVGWVVGGYLVATALGLMRGMAGASRRLAGLRTGAFAIYGVVSGFAGWLITEPIMGVLHGHGLALIGIGALLVFAVATFTAALQSALGIGGTGVAILLFVVLGNPSSGGPFPWDFLPGFWKTIGPYLPTGAATELVRNTLYFGGSATARSILVLIAYAVIGVIGTVLFARRFLPLDGTDPQTKDDEKPVLAAEV